MHAEISGTVAGLVFSRQALEIEEIGATHEPFDAFKDGILGRSSGTFSLVLEFLGEKAPERLAFLHVLRAEVRQPLRIWNFKLTTRAHWRVLSPQPASPIAGFEFLELIAFRAGIQKDKIRDGTIQLSELLGEDRAKRRPNERGPGLGSAAQKVDALEVLVGLGLHGAHDRQFISDAGAAGHQLAEMNARKLSGNATERPT